MEDTLPSHVTEEDARALAPTVLMVAYHPDSACLGRAIPLSADGLTLGRDQAVDGLPLRGDRRLSRAHAELLQLRGRVVVHDLKSRNGTWVNGKRVAHAELQPGDVLRVGSVALVLRDAPEPAGPHEGLLGAGHAHAALCGQIDAYAPRDTVVLLEGEPGAGKGVVARALHRASGRSGPLVTFDCGAVAPGVMHSELFGHRAGAFSGATARRGGLIEQAAGGTLFLDEIGDASPELQRSLLRLLEEGEYRPVGADRPLRADVRVIAATNRDLDARVADESFRFDLLTRLRRLHIRVPPLRDRIEDVPLLATRIASERAGQPMVLHRQLAFAMLEHDWPGNVRELDAVVERALVGAGSGRMLRFSEGLLPDAPSSLRATPTRAAATPPAPPRPTERPSPDDLGAMLRRHHGNVTHLAREIGVARHTLYRWVREAGLDLEAFR